MSITRKELYAAVADKANRKPAEVSQIMESFFEKVKEELDKGNEVNIWGFLKFRILNIKARNYAHPKKGSGFIIKKPSRTRIKVKLGKFFKSKK